MNHCETKHSKLTKIKKIDVITVIVLHLLGKKGERSELLFHICMTSCDAWINPISLFFFLMLVTIDESFLVFVHDSVEKELFLNTNKARKVHYHYLQIKGDWRCSFKGRHIATCHVVQQKSNKTEGQGGEKQLLKPS